MKMDKSKDFELVSALMDNEIDSNKEHFETLKKLLDSGEMQTRWYKYHLISDCLKHQDEIGNDISGNLKEKLIKKPVLRHKFRRLFAANESSFSSIAASIAILALSFLVVWQAIDHNSLKPQDNFTNANSTNKTYKTVLYNSQDIDNKTETTELNETDTEYLKLHEAVFIDDSIKSISF